MVEARGDKMYPRRARRIGYTDAAEYEGVFEFYKRLERRQQGECLWKLCMALSVPVMLWMSIWCGTQYVDWSHFGGGSTGNSRAIASSGSITK
jgi:hypothetical protein